MFYKVLVPLALSLDFYFVTEGSAVSLRVYNRHADALQQTTSHNRRRRKHHRRRKDTDGDAKDGKDADDKTKAGKDDTTWWDALHEKDTPLEEYQKWLDRLNNDDGTGDQDTILWKEFESFKGEKIKSEFWAMVCNGIYWSIYVVELKVSA